MANDGTINLRIDRRNMEVIARTGQSIGVRVNNALDRYGFLMEARRSEVMEFFEENELDALALAMKHLGPRICAATLRDDLRAAYRRDPDAPPLDYAMKAISDFDLIVLAEALEGRAVSLVAQR